MKIYLAGSLFSEGDIAQRLLEAKLLREKGFEVYNPIEAPMNEDKSTLASPQTIYINDTKELLSSDVMIVDLTNSHDPGVMAEIGVVAGYNECGGRIQILGVISDIRLPDSNKYSIPTYGYNHYVLGAVLTYGEVYNSFSELISNI